MQSSIDIEQEKLKEALKRIQLLERNLAESMACSETLDKDLQIASKSIVRLTNLLFKPSTQHTKTINDL